MQDIHWFTATEAADAIANGKISSVELLEACLAHIQKRDTDTQAWVQLDADAALKAARQCDASAPIGPLHGVPVGIKDVFDTADLPTAYGSPLFQDHQPLRDANCVNMIRQAGGIVLGKTVTTEFALYHPNKTRNPHHLGRTPGGSSSGSAAAVADGQIPLALGSQSSGSIIRPAAFCGVVGYKPSVHLFSATGMSPLSAALDTVGGFARSVDDMHLLWNTLHCHRQSGPLPKATRRRVAYCQTPYWNDTSPAQRNAMQDSAERLARNGFEVENVTLPAWFDSLNDIHARILAYDVARNYVREYAPGNRKMLSPGTLRVIEQGWSVSTDEYLAARDVQRRAIAAYTAIMENVDALLVPAAPGAAPDIATTGNPMFNQTWTLLGVPAMTLPVASDDDGMPLGAQFVAGLDCDVQLMSVCAAAESVFGRPPAPNR